MRTIYRWRWVAMSVAALAMTALLGGLSVHADATAAEKPVAPAGGTETIRFRLRSEPVEAPAPGTTTPLRIRLTNPHDGRVRIDALVGSVLTVSRPDCHATTSDLTVGPYHAPPGLPFTLGPGETVDAGTIPVFVPPAASAACRTATYQFLIIGTGVRLPASQSA
ncbi:hypothetical protein [Catenuloplanes indicus]|uniref:Secreted protein n=1 Tax=Catenuloplanes indicus TaxID=137267 RepID=A0AAE3W3B1_9ACTN|nr:hypothetical protein [Catenuloplanes indicus]MDQ0368576.1 hypothetical protein [Catenuloplanes indicus]